MFLKKRKKYILHALISIVSLVGIYLFINTISPDEKFTLINFIVSPVILLFFLIFMAIGGLSIFILANVRRGILISIFFVTFLLLQFLKYNSPFYIGTLAVIIILIEFLFWKKK